MITLKEAELLVKMARAAIKGEPFTEKLPKSFNENYGIFVTLLTYPTEELRGCIGYTETEIKLSESVQKVAYSAANEDTRFLPVKEEELDNLLVEISILLKPEPVSVEDIKTNDGVIIKKGTISALFLPQVWKHLPDKKDFLDALCSKAGMFPGCWKEEGTEILRFGVTAFKEEKPEGKVVKVEI